MLFDFIVAELARRETRDPRRIRPIRIALENQRDDLLAFAGMLDEKLAAIARVHEVSGSLVREGKSPRESMTGENHRHWLTLLGLGPLQPRQI
jgi:hypothetical protein